SPCVRPDGSGAGANRSFVIPHRTSVSKSTASPTTPIRREQIVVLPVPLAPETIDSVERTKVCAWLHSGQIANGPVESIVLSARYAPQATQTFITTAHHLACSRAPRRPHR